jgi:hypothetical protein
VTVAKEPDRRGEHEGSRKTIARGMPGDSGVTVVTTCTLFAAAHRRPAFPAPSDWRVEENSGKSSGGLRREVVKSYLLFEIRVSQGKARSSSSGRSLARPVQPGQFSGVFTRVPAGDGQEPTEVSEMK